MIELIFVIIIIGILSAVAIPRLAATRDDAKAATCMNDALVLINDLRNYYTTKGELDLLPYMTNLALDADKNNKVNGIKIDTVHARGGDFWCDGGAMMHIKIESNSTFIGLNCNRYNDRKSK